MRIVISAVNFVSGGPLSILRDFTEQLCGYRQDVEVIALVNNRSLLADIACTCSNLQLIEYPLAKKSWIFRFHFEYIKARRFSKELQPDLWISLHDMTPNVGDVPQVVYCHNPSVFYKAKLADLFINYKFYLFTKFYKYLYKINIKKNKYVIVQQNWIRERFRDMFGVDNIIVANPDYGTDYSVDEVLANIDHKIDDVQQSGDEDIDQSLNLSDTRTFVYPAFPRCFKNFEVICEAVRQLHESGVSGYRVVLTIDGSENRYAGSIVRKYSYLEEIDFCGLRPRDEIIAISKRCSALIFPSKLETWGLPIIEFKALDKPILLADEIYARETLGEYDKCAFFQADDASRLAVLMKSLIDGSISYDQTSSPTPPPPYASNWRELIELITLESDQGISDPAEVSDNSSINEKARVA